MDDSEIPLGEATAEQMVMELARRELAYMLSVETVEPGIGGKPQVRIFIKAIPQKAKGMLGALKELVKRLE